MARTVTRIFFLCTPVFIFLFSISQNKHADLYRILSAQLKKADSLYNAATALGNSPHYTEQEEERLNKGALSIYKDVFQKAPASANFDSIRFFSAFKSGELEHYFEHFREALSGYNNAVAVKLKSRLPDSLLFKPYLYAGIIYYNQNKYDTASIYFKNAESIQLQYHYLLQESERLYNTFGALYYEKGDYRQAKNYFLKSIEVLPKSHPYYKELYSTYNINLAQIYFKLEDYDRANEIYQALLHIDGIDKNKINQNIGLINLYLGAAAKAIGYFRRVNYQSSNKLIWLYQNMGEAFLNLQQKDSAVYYLNKAIESSGKFGSNTDHIAYGQTLKTFGDLEGASSHFNEALQYYQQALHQFYPAFANRDATSNPSEFSGVFSYINLFNTLVAKAEACHAIYTRSPTIEAAKQELSAYQSAFHLIDYVERTYNSDESRLFLDKIKYVVHTKPIDIAFELFKKTGDRNYLEALYIFDQQNKASVLAVKSQSQLSSADTTLLSRERNIRSEITRLSLRASQINDSSQLAGINGQIRDLEIELGKVQEKTSSGALSNKIPSADFLRKKFLDQHTALISFHLSEDKLTTLLIRQDRFDCFQQTLFPGFHEAVLNYIDGLRKPLSNDSSLSDSRHLFSFLFNQLDLENIDRLILIPDDELNYLSFESLQNEKGEFIVRNYSVQYQYSTTLLKKERVRFAGHQTLAFAPFANEGFQDSTLQLQSLPNSLPEIRDLKGEKFTGAAATKEHFLANLSKYKVIHLATHAFVNNEKDDLSFVSFYPSLTKNRSDYLLYSEEIYNLPLDQTELVILSACETGSGSLVKGEGVMSLSRAFAYAGCSNIITSLWNANDFSTAYLTNKLHYYLDKDLSIDEALRQSKLDFLNDKTINPRLKAPYYWSHLVFVGNYSTEKASYTWWIVGGLGLLLLLFVFFKIKKPRPKVRPSHS